MGEIFRDAYGIPHLRADSLLELAHLQGVEAAGSRGRQLELERHRAEGRLAELVGEAGIEADLFARRAGLAATARAAFDGLDPETRAFVAAYADGVEAGLRVNRAVVQVDSAERPWHPWTPLAVFLGKQALFANFPGTLWRRRLEATYGAVGLDAFTRVPMPAAGSNAFGVTGERTASGFPLVGGDPHRLFEAPNVYLQVRLACTDPDDAFDVAGFTFPGVPGVQHFAHAGAVAWAITNAMADYQQTFLERLDRRGEEVWSTGPHGPERCEVRHETLRVRGGADRDVEVVVTPRGSVVVGEVDGPPGETVSVRMTSSHLGDLGFAALLPLLRARTADDVEAAFAHWVEPVNNLVVADRGGALRHRVVGRVPAGRATDLPLAADDPRAAEVVEWVSPLPRGPLVDGAVVTANDRTTTEFSRIGRDFATPWRAERIRELLSARADWTAADLRGVSLDVRVGGVDALLDSVEAAVRVDGVGGSGVGGGVGADERALLDRLRRWDRTMTVDSVEAAEFVRLREAVVDGLATALSPLDTPSPYGVLYEAWFSLRPRVLGAVEALLGGGAASLGVDVEAVLRSALTRAAESQPEEVWGASHRFHPLTAADQLGLTGADRELVGTGTPDCDGAPVAGDDACVACTHALPGAPVTSRGPVARYVWDLADPALSHWAVPLGAAEAGLHSEDQFAAWSGGELVPLVTDWALLTRETPAP